MRTWRKLYSSILESEQVAQLSDPAAYLLALLIAAQDDTGYYPWTPVKIRRLIAARPAWTTEHTQSFANELVTAELATMQEGGIILTSGAKRNGRPREDKAIDICPRISSVTLQVAPIHDGESLCLEADGPQTVQGPSIDCPRVEKEQSREREEKEKTAPSALHAATKTQSLDDWLSELAGDFPELNIPLEYKHCQAWMEEHRKRGPPSKARLINWLKKAREIREEHNNGRVLQAAYGRGEAAKSRASTPASDTTPVDWGVVYDEEPEG